MVIVINIIDIIILTIRMIFAMFEHIMWAHGAMMVIPRRPCGRGSTIVTWSTAALGRLAAGLAAARPVGAALA